MNALRSVKWGHLPPNDVSRIAHYVLGKKKEVNQESKGSR